MSGVVEERELYITTGDPGETKRASISITIFKLFTALIQPASHLLLLLSPEHHL